MANSPGATEKRRAVAVWCGIVFLNAPCWLHIILQWRLYFPNVTHIVCLGGAVAVFALGYRGLGPVLLRLFEKPIPGNVMTRIGFWAIGIGLTYGWLLLLTAAVSPLVGGDFDRRVLSVVEANECTTKCYGCRYRATVELWTDSTARLCVEGTAANGSIQVDGFFSQSAVIVRSARAHEG